MDSRRFLGLHQSHNPYRWSMEVTGPLSTWGGFLFGGCGLGAAVAAMEDTSGRQCIWATAQYLSYARPGEVMDIDVNLAATGHQTTQARAVCHVGNREILTVNAALGHRTLQYTDQWETMPDVPPPLQCPLRTKHLPRSGTIEEQLEQRLAKGLQVDELDGRRGDGQVLMWTRVPEQFHRLDATFLAVLGDWVPFGVGQSFGIRAGGNSLDNTLRVVHVVPTDWVLLDIRVHAVERGFGHGLVHMFAEDGTLLATASQSCIVRLWKGDAAVNEDGATPQGEEPT